MRVLGIPESEIAALVRSVSTDDPDRDALLDRFGRAAWSGIAEPGDADAGRLVAGLGALAALDLLVRGVDGAGIEAELRAAGDPERGDLDPGDLGPGDLGPGDLGPGDLGPSDLDRGRFTEALARWRPRVDSAAVLRSLRQAARFGARFVAPDDAGWPSGLHDLGVHAPAGLWIRGPALAAGMERSIAIVGARAATGYGEHVTIEAASGLVDRGFVIVSGAAYGIDGAAHRAALVSHGTTVAFLAGGVDRYYPSGHETLLNRIAESGAVISEVPCGVAPTKWRFLQRNRLIAAASAATVVMEAGWRSGSLNTAGHAAQLGRPLGAVPGPVTSSASAGCHRMIREYDAVCVTNAEEMAELVVPGDVLSRADDGSAATANSSGNRVRVLDALSDRSRRPVDRIAALSGLAPDRVRAELGLLAVEGAVSETEAGWMKRR